MVDTAGVLFEVVRAYQHLAIATRPFGKTQHTHPPSTLTTAPVMNEASDPSKKTITFAISDASACLFSAVTCLQS